MYSSIHCEFGCPEGICLRLPACKEFAVFYDKSIESSFHNKLRLLTNRLKNLRIGVPLILRYARRSEIQANIAREMYDRYLNWKNDEEKDELTDEDKEGLTKAYLEDYIKARNEAELFYKMYRIIMEIE